MVGAGGYAGQVLHALLMHHPCITPVVAEAREPTPAALDALHDCGAVALCIPEDAARSWTAALRERGIRTLDLSGAHRQTDGIHYGLPELMGAPPSDALVVANPGCYPTATLLVLAPLLRAELIEPEGISVLGNSGTSGAGKGLRDDLHFSELFGNAFPYAVGTHRHTPEIERYLAAPVSFVTTLIPIVRGLIITAFVRTAAEPEQLSSALRSFYAKHPWISVLPSPGPGLGVRHVIGTHQALLAVGATARGGVVPVFASIDNLMRGAASQAVHNLNLWLDLPVYAGLPQPLRTAPDGVPGMNRQLP
jgi:N-acetyl-gamma-glutamyl-phosphate reductase